VARRGRVEARRLARTGAGAELTAGLGAAAVWASVVGALRRRVAAGSSSASIGLLIAAAKAITFLPGSNGSLLRGSAPCAIRKRTVVAWLPGLTRKPGSSTRCSGTQSICAPRLGGAGWRAGQLVEPPVERGPVAACASATSKPFGRLPS
jgi:hypothetical protein